jgi:hypothetical protein
LIRADGSFNRMPGGVFMNSPRFLAKLAHVDLNGVVKPEIEVFDFCMIHIPAETFRQSFNKIQKAKRDTGFSADVPF